MNKNPKCVKPMLFMTVFMLLVAVLPGSVWAHCDMESGPVAIAARKAVETGEFDIIAIWVGERQAKELRVRFDEALAVYNIGGKAKAFAERYFMETSVRLHREAEGMTYTGLKPALPLPPDIVKAEKALDTGNLKPVTDLLYMELQKETQKWFQKALDAKKRYKGESVEAGRGWVDAYVTYVIYVHGLHKRIQAGPEHGVGHVE